MQENAIYLEAKILGIRGSLSPRNDYQKVSTFTEPKSVHVEFNLQKNGFQMVESDLLILRKIIQELLEQHFPKYIPRYVNLSRCFSKKEFIVKMMEKYYTQLYCLKGFTTCITTLKHLKSPAVKYIYVICFKLRLPKLMYS